MNIVLAKKAAYCPVAEYMDGPDEVKHRYALGYLVKGEKCAFVCRECGFIYTWDEKGHLMAPVKLEPVRKTKACDCGGCEFRDEQKRYNRPL